MKRWSVIALVALLAAFAAPADAHVRNAVTTTMLANQPLRGFSSADCSLESCDAGGNLGQTCIDGTSSIWICDGAGAFVEMSGQAAPGGRTYHVCASGCDYATLDAALDGISPVSSAASPVTIIYHAGLYTTRATCTTGHQYLSIIGEGTGATRHVVAGLSSNQGAIDFDSTCDYMTVSNMYVSGNVAIHDQGDGDMFYSNLLLESPHGAAIVGHCIRRNGATTTTRAFVTDVVCRTAEEGFTPAGANGANYEWYGRGNVIVNTAGGEVSDGSFCWNFGSNIAYLYEKGGVCNRTHSAAGDGVDFGCIESKQNNDGGKNGGLMVYDNLTCRLRSTAAADSSVDLFGAAINETTYTLDSTLRLINPDIDVLVDNLGSGGTGNDAYGIQLDNTAATNAIIEISGGRIDTHLSVNGVDLVDKHAGDATNIKVRGTAFLGTTANVNAFDYGDLDMGPMFTSNGIRLDVDRITDANDPALTLYAANIREAITIKHNSATPSYSPYLQFCDTLDESQCYRLRIDNTGNIEVYDEGGNVKFEIEDDGDMFHYGPTFGHTYNGGTNRIGSGGSSENNRLWFWSSNSAQVYWRSATKRIQMTGVELLQLDPTITMPACSATIEGAIVYDGDGTKGFCECDGSAWHALSVADCTVP